MVSGERVIEEAGRRILSLSSCDASARVSELNAVYGLGKIMFALQEISADINPLFCLFAPDGGISRNKERWSAGFSYGCYLRWPGPEVGIEITFPQIRPNACGVLVAKINERPSYMELCERLETGSRKHAVLDNYRLNLGVSNHFVEIAEVMSSNLSKVNTGDVLVFIHTSPSERKEELYDCDFWQEKGGQWLNTPLGKIFTLTGNNALEYFAKYKEIEEFGAKKRQIIAENIFDEIEILCNPTHQGMEAVNVARLGLYNSTDTSTSVWDSPVFPLTLRWDLPIYLIKGTPNLNKTVLPEKMMTAADSLDILDYLDKVHILPHGGGYKIPFSSKGWHMEENNDRRFFKINNNDMNYIFSYPSELPYHYRGLEITEKIMELQLGEVGAMLKQVYTLRY